METVRMRRGTAYHEAGHAVAAVRFKLGCERVELTADRSGFCRNLDDWESTFEPSEEDARRAVVLLFAGYAAELHDTPGRADEARIGTDSDNETAAAILSLLGQDEEPLRQRAAAFVAAEWTAIVAVAEELLRRERLDGTEVELVVAEADGDPDAGAALVAYRRLAAARASRIGVMKTVNEGVSAAGASARVELFRAELARANPGVRERWRGLLGAIEEHGGRLVDADPETRTVTAAVSSREAEPAIGAALAEVFRRDAGPHGWRVRVLVDGVTGPDAPARPRG